MIKKSSLVKKRIMHDFMKNKLIKIAFGQGLVTAISKVQ